MIDSETDYIEINSEPFSDVLWEVVDHTTQSIGIGTISIVVASKEAIIESCSSRNRTYCERFAESLKSESAGSDELTASEATEGGSLITLKWLCGGDSINVEEINGEKKASVKLDNVVTVK